MISVTGIVSGIALAGAPPMPPTPTPVPQAPSSGGYSPPQESYSPPAFQPYTESLKSGDGSVIGTLSGIDSSTVRISASSNATISGNLILLDVGADFSSKPSGVTMDISMDGKGNVPGGMDNVVILAATSIKSQNSWGLSPKPGTSAIKFTVPASELAGADNGSEYYLVRYDGTGYQIISVNPVSGNETATIEAHVSDISGVFTVVMTMPPASKAVQETTVTQVQAPTSAPTQTPTPAPAGVTGLIPSLWVSAFGTFVIGEVAGVVILLGLGRFMH